MNFATRDHPMPRCIQDNPQKQEECEGYYPDHDGRELCFYRYSTEGRCESCFCFGIVPDRPRTPTPEGGDHEG